MTLQMVLRTTSFTTVVTAIVACVCYLFINASAPVVIATAAVFAVYIAISTEAFQALYHKTSRPAYGMVHFMVLGLGVYLLTSKALGQPLFSQTMKDGVIGCIFFTLFGGFALFMAEVEDSGVGFYAFSGMLAGFVFQPLIAACGYASAPNLTLAMTGSIVGAGVALVHRYFVNRELRHFLNGMNKEIRTWQSR